MASLITTMFVPGPPNFRSPLHKRPPSLLQASAISSPKPLAPISTLEHSVSCIHLEHNAPVYTKPKTTASAPCSPLKSLVFAAGWKRFQPAVCTECDDDDDNDVFTEVPLQTEPAHDNNALGIHSVLLALRHAALQAYETPLEIQEYCTSLPHCHDSPSRSYSPEVAADILMRSNSRARGPFKPQRPSRGTSTWQLKQFADATLGSGSLKKAVKLPEGEDLNEWLAVNVVDFYNQINLLYGSITEFCSPQSCPEMKATDEFEYLWQDNENFKRPTKMPAPEYIEHLMTWCQNNIDNEQMFPSRIGVPFPKTFPSLVRQMFKRLYRVYAHIYCHHFPVIAQLGLDPHLNTSFKHYVLFIHEHSLASGKDYWGPLGDLVEKMLESD